MTDPATELDFGSCCSCGTLGGVHAVVFMETARAPVKGTGWGCVPCGLPSDGAIAVVCDRCAAEKAPIRFVIRGSLVGGARAPIEEHRGEHRHDPRNHPERQGS